MKRLIISVLFASCLTNAAFAALPPYYQRLDEIGRVMQDARVKQALRDEPIERIEMIERDLYRVTAGKCRVDVAIVDQERGTEPAMPGPRLFDVSPREPVCE
jgi:hypothetical protein